ncbi:non-hydrolyzing UDP-N-acetylglucosamine 2-epimerase [Arenimonas soli]|uniref:non-hydrolyzing UDP-N-acetylglucosamine 2-epimerase n=1 Tax=Arenimonas soli TaxID=2269504 RepID=UPI001669D531|nr:UDP-N-acetylglucosamine 2-epimerase (non-hydrolyzing) [Arenimonas soli]
MKIALIAGTRPNFVKAAPLHQVLSADPERFSPAIWVVSQHRAPALNGEVLEDLMIPATALMHIAVDDGPIGQRLGQMIDAIGEALKAGQPDLVVVFGDVDTTLAGAIAAKRMQLPLVHVEAGLRSHDRAMPEELNRRMVDAIADLLMTTSEDAANTLVRCEGQPAGHVHFVGNVMIDALLRTVDRDHGRSLCSGLGVAPGQFAMATFHRPSNVDAEPDLLRLLSMLSDATRRLPVLLPLHPRTHAALVRHGLEEAARSIEGLHLLPSLRYRDFVSLLSLARVALTDSGGIQEETSVLGVPCLTVRENTERPVTVDQGSNRLVGPGEVAAALDAIMAAPPPEPARIPGWDGNAALRIAEALAAWAPEVRP